MINLVYFIIIADTNILETVKMTVSQNTNIYTLKKYKIKYLVDLR